MTKTNVVAEPTEVHYPYGQFWSSLSLGQAPGTQTQTACPRPRNKTTMNKAPYSLSEFGRKSTVKLQNLSDISWLA